MIHNIQKLLEEYDRRHSKHHIFSIMDVKQLHDLGNGDSCLTITYALRAGYMVGRYAARRQKPTENGAGTS